MTVFLVSRHGDWIIPPWPIGTYDKHLCHVHMSFIQCTMIFGEKNSQNSHEFADPRLRAHSAISTQANVNNRPLFED
jgi:hypothetical protein